MSMDFTKQIPSMQIAGHSANPLSTLQIMYPWPLEKPSVPADEWPLDVDMDTLLTAFTDNTRVYVEVGVWLGTSLRRVLDSSHIIHAIAIDTWTGSPEHLAYPLTSQKIPTLYETFLVNCWDYMERIIPVKENSWNGLEIVHRSGVRPDVIFIDADHTYASVYKDIETALQLFPNATICGHDFYAWPDVNKAVKELAEQYGKTIVGNDVWIYR